MPQRSATELDTTPYWSDSVSLPVFPRVAKDERFDVVVVGGGITGLTAAYLLTKAGRRVAVLERDRCGRIDTGHTTAHLTMVTDARLTDLERNFGRDHARAVWDAGLAAIAQIDDTARNERIDCGFEWVPGYLHAALDDSGNDERKSLRDEATLASDLGFDASYVDRVPIIERPGIRFEEQARFHPRKYLSGLVRSLAARGAQIYEHSAVEEFRDEPLAVRANGCTFTCDDVVIATHTPLVGINNVARATLFQTKLALYTSYVVAGRVPHGQLPDALFWDTADPYHYLRLDPHRDFDVVIFGGLDHKTGQSTDTDACFERLEHRLRSVVRGITITHRWSGQVIETPDGLPYIGQVVDHQYAATGFAGNGMTFGVLAAMMISEALLGRRSPWSELFDMGRTKIRGGLWDYITENADYPYYLIRDRFAGVEGRTLRSVKRGQGRILELDGKRCAVYRDDNGAAAVRSAICTHMGCVVGWNEAERTWDCPCHGSRFKPTGEVIAGPAESPLSEP